MARLRVRVSTLREMLLLVDSLITTYRMDLGLKKERTIFLKEFFKKELKSKAN